MKGFYKGLLAVLFLGLLLSGSISAIAVPDLLNLNGDVRNKDLSGYDLRDKEEILFTLTFDTHTRWPAQNRLPANFSPRDILEYGKDPGLNVRKLHELGYTGKGVNIAYIDQPLLVNHLAYRGANIHYYKIRPYERGMNSSMHGPAVASLLLGKGIGVAPESNLYFFAHPAWLRDQNTHAEALKKLIALNQNLPPGRKIRIVGFSDAPDPREKNIEAYKAAIQEAEANDIMVFDVETVTLVPLTIHPFQDKNNPENWTTAFWSLNRENEPNALFVPTGGRTTASGWPEKNDTYAYWTGGGLSWAVPYIVGTIALGLQIDPALTKEQAIKYLMESAYPRKNGGIINPEGFVQLVEKNKPEILH